MNTHSFESFLFSLNHHCAFCLCAITASFAPICFAIKAKENDMLPLEKNRVRLDDDSDEDKVWFSFVITLLTDQGLI